MVDFGGKDSGFCRVSKVIELKECKILSEIQSGIELFFGVSLYRSYGALNTIIVPPGY